MTRAGISEKRREQVRERADHRCEYCRCPEGYSPSDFVVDHVRPRSRGGRDSLDNLALACTGCNQAKHDHVAAVDPDTGEMVALYDPRQDHWGDHFAWSEDITQIVGQTPVGKATVALLDLNRSGVVNLRRTLVPFGLHPPDEEMDA